VLAVEALAELGDAALEPRADRRELDALLLRDLADLEALEESQQDRPPVRLLEREHVTDQVALQRRARDELGGVGERLFARGRLLAGRPARLRASRLARRVPHDAREPSADVPCVARRALESG
jgi:hypothetical protein